MTLAVENRCVVVDYDLLPHQGFIINGEERIRKIEKELGLCEYLPTSSNSESGLMMKGEDSQQSVIRTQVSVFKLMFHKIRAFFNKYSA